MTAAKLQINHKALTSWKVQKATELDSIIAALFKYKGNPLDVEIYNLALTCPILQSRTNT